MSSCFVLPLCHSMWRLLYFVQSQHREHVCSFRTLCTSMLFWTVCRFDVCARQRVCVFVFVCICVSECVVSLSEREHAIRVYGKLFSDSNRLFCVFFFFLFCRMNFFVKCSRYYQTSFSSEAIVQPFRRTFCNVLFQSEFISIINFLSHRNPNQRKRIQSNSNSSAGFFFQQRIVFKWN